MLFKTVFTALLASFVATAAAEAASITVQGQGQVTAQPDRAMLSVGVNSRNEDPVKAQTENTKTMTKLVAALQAAGVKATDMQTSGFSFQRLTDSSNDAPASKPDYRSTNNVSIVVRDIAQIGDIIARAIQNGGNDIGQLEFFVSEPKPYVARARQSAFDKAHEEALANAEAAHMKLGPVLRISNGNATLPQQLSCNECADAPGPDSVQDLRPVTLAGALTIGYSVEVEYELLPGE